MRSTNPVLRRRERTWGMGSSSSAPWSTRAPVVADSPAAAVSVRHGDAPSPARDSLMTIDDVVARTAITLGVVVFAAVLSWVLLPVDPANIGTSYGIAIGAGLIALGLAVAQSFMSRPLPALILGYAAFEGVFLGVISSATSSQLSSGVVVQAVVGTMAVFAGVLIAYKMQWIRVTRRFYGYVTAAALGFVILTAADLLVSAFVGGDGLGFRSGGLGILFGVIGIVLGACFLALHFKQIEDGVSQGASREESWYAAFGLTVTLVWIYVEILNLLTLVSEDNL
ncbi:Bax inhibitor-1/YccA family protein [Streptomyces fagopyri]|uniref:Bax inhibitor-1/YccA family protein n=1 Tax=Streptomyces fagopyri TaxID=2662397 RepID=UPI003F4D2C4D